MSRTLVAAGLILVGIPALIAAGIVFLSDRQYMIVSLGIVVCAMAPFAMVFEKRKPQARELVVVAALAGIAAAGRVAFFMTPQIKPVAAIVIIAGVTMGAESGFLVGAMAGLVSNFFFGQGPWTPWQMFCFGIIGFLAGLLAKAGLLSRRRGWLCAFGFAATFLVYGGIINIGAMLMWAPEPSWALLGATYLSGIPFDLGHAGATALFLFLIAKPMIEKLDRIRTKYGLIQT